MVNLSLKFINSWQFFHQIHCVKSVRVWRFSGSCFPLSDLNTEYIILQIRRTSVQMRDNTDQKTSNTQSPWADTFFWLPSRDKIQYRFSATSGCLVSRKYDELSQSVAFGQKLRDFTDRVDQREGTTWK